MFCVKNCRPATTCGRQLGRQSSGLAAALAERVGVTTYPTYERGVNIEFYDGRSYRYDGDSSTYTN
jgi:hypothetical protein